MAIQMDTGNQMSTVVLPHCLDRFDGLPDAVHMLVMMKRFVVVSFLVFVILENENGRGISVHDDC